MLNQFPGVCPGTGLVWGEVCFLLCTGTPDPSSTAPEPAPPPVAAPRPVYVPAPVLATVFTYVPVSRPVPASLSAY